MFRDEDLFTELRVDLSKPTTNKWEFHFFGTARDVLDDHRNDHNFSPFEDVGDTYHSRIHSYLFEAHLDLNNPFWRVSQVRIGRQDGTRDEPVFFDGVATDIRVTSGINITAYGGAAVHLYELDNTWGRDTLAGIGLDVKPASATLISLDYLHTDDNRKSSGNLSWESTQHNQLASLRLSHRFSPNLRMSAKGRYIDGDPRDGQVRIVATAPELGMELNASYLRQFRTQYELSNELSSYYDILGKSDPYQSYDVKARKLFGSRVAVDVGYFKRELVHPQQETALNHAYSRSYGMLDVSDLFTNGLSMAITGEQWKSGARQTYNSSGFDIGYAFKKGRRAPKVNVGAYYSLYKYDYYFSLGERVNVKTYYAKFEYPFAQRYFLSGGYEYEQGIENYQTAKLGMRYEF